MKKLKNFLLLFLIFSFFCFIPNTYAYEIDGTTFTNVRVYNAKNGALILDPTNNVNSWINTLAWEEISYYLRIEAVNPSSVASGQMLLYTNICSSIFSLQYYDNIENSLGRLNKLQQIANNVSEPNTCTTPNGVGGRLIQSVYSFSYTLVRDSSSGSSFLDTKVYFKNNEVVGYPAATSFVNVYIAPYDESVVQNLIKQQETQKTNELLEQQISEHQKTNNKLDDMNENIGQTNDKLDDVNDNLGDLNDNITNNDISGSQNTANGFFNNFTNNDYGLSSIITIPISSIQKITNATCSPINIPIPFTNKNIPLPCMTTLYQQNVPVLLNIWQIVSFGLISYAVIVDIFGMVKKFKDPNDDKLEVMDL